MSNRRKAKDPALAVDEPQHSTPEERAAAGYDIATFDDLEDLDRDTLLVVASDCPAPEVDSLICVPCRAYEMVLEMDKEAALEKLANPLGVSDQVVEDNENPGLAEHLQENLAEAIATPTDTEILDARPVIVAKVRELDLLVQQMLAGPPIPPPNVTLDDLAALVVGSEKWLTHISRQIDDGYVLPPETRKAYNTVSAVVKRMKP